MSSLADPRAILTGLLLILGLLCMLRRTDPAILLSRWLYAFRRAVYIAGTMIADTPGEYSMRWKQQRPRDAEALERLAAEFPAGETE